jgi:hypothetical protein
MIKVSIIKSSQVTNEAQFPSQEAAQAWLDYHEGIGSFGQKEGFVEQPFEVSPAVYAEEGDLLIPAQVELQEVEITPAVYGVEGDLVEPAHYEMVEVEIAPAIYALGGEILVPAQYEMQEVFVPGYSVQIEDKTAEMAAEALKQARIARGKEDRQKCENALDLIAGYNRERTLTIEQITQMQQTFAQAEALLRANRPDFAKQVIQAIQPDGTLITSEMKADVLAILE